jgi:hypothetical protein
LGNVLLKDYFSYCGYRGGSDSDSSYSFGTNDHSPTEQGNEKGGFQEIYFSCEK